MSFLSVPGSSEARANLALLENSPGMVELTDEDLMHATGAWAGHQHQAHHRHHWCHWHHWNRWHHVRWDWHWEGWSKD